MKTFLATLLCLASPAAAQTPRCFPHEHVMERLAEGFGETRQALALDQTRAMIEVWANLKTGTWSITRTMPGGLTCIVSSGESFEIAAAAPAPVGEMN